MVLLLSVCLSLNVKTFSSYSKTDLVTRLIFGMKVHLIHTHLMVPRSRSYTKVTLFKILPFSGASEFHKHSLFSASASFSVISAKAVSSMVQLTFGGNSQLGYFSFYIMFFVMISTAIIQVK